MNSSYDVPTGVDARVALDELMARVGVDGLVAALRSPGLLAAVDQHAAAVREAMLVRAGRVDAAGLADYAKSVTAAAHRMGRPLPDPAGHSGDVHWSRAGWHLLRLLAVCFVAEEGGLL